MSVATRMRLGTIIIFPGFSLYKCHIHMCQMCPVQAVLAVSMELLGPLHLLRSESAACLPFHIVVGYCAALWWPSGLDSAIWLRDVKGSKEGWLLVGVEVQWKSSGTENQIPWVWSPAVPPFFGALNHFTMSIFYTNEHVLNHITCVCRVPPPDAKMCRHLKHLLYHKWKEQDNLESWITILCSWVLHCMPYYHCDPVQEVLVGKGSDMESAMHLLTLWRKQSAVIPSLPALWLHLSYITVYLRSDIDQCTMTAVIKTSPMISCQIVVGFKRISVML